MIYSGRKKCFCLYLQILPRKKLKNNKIYPKRILKYLMRVKMYILCTLKQFFVHDNTFIF